MNDELPANLRPIGDFFGLVGTAPVRKDFHVVRTIGVIAALDAAPFNLIFCGGTALARAHRLVRRMSEDVDFKVVFPTPTNLSTGQLRPQLGRLRERVTTALQAAGFPLTPGDESNPRSKDSNQYIIWQLPYDSGGAEDWNGLRPTIKVELNYSPLRTPSVLLPISSFVAEALRRPPEVPAIPCVSLAQTAAEKLVSLTRRIAMERAGISRSTDPTLVRHIYDLHVMRDHVDPTVVAALAYDAASADAVQFRKQDPAYAADIAGVTREVLTAIQTDSIYRSRYYAFMAAMVYGERPEFDDAMATVVALAERSFM